MRRSGFEEMDVRRVVVVFVLLLNVAVHAMIMKIDCEYGYENDDIGPDRWSHICPDSWACNNGLKQSPINIITNSSFLTEAEPISASYVELNNLVFENLGHTVEIYNSDSAVGISGGPLPGFYTLVEVHFHTPSEHTFNGERYPFEMHLVHSYANASKLAVLAFFFDSSSTTPHPFLNQLVEYLPYIPEIGNTTHVDAHLEVILNSVRGSYYHYAGSLTTPPCYEIVDWFFSENILHATPAQIASFKAEVNNNNRPIQPTNNRLISEYKVSGATTPPNKYGTLVLATIISITAAGVGAVAAVITWTWQQRKKNKQNFIRIDLDAALNNSDSEIGEEAL